MDTLSYGSPTCAIDVRPVATGESCGDFAGEVVLDEHRMSIFVGDVAGRGPRTGSIASKLSAHLRRTLAARRSLRAVVTDLDARLTDDLDEETPFVSLFVATIDGRARSCTYVSAGHEPALLLRGHRHDHLGPTGPILGVGIPLAFDERQVTCDASSTLIVVTDGITEARRRDGDALDYFGTNGVAHAAHRAIGVARDLAGDIHAAATFYARAALRDDATVLVARQRVHGWTPIPSVRVEPPLVAAAGGGAP
jgi:sigma-B regulation protein RsbU (phosphoserine phosphatase)